MADAKEAIIWVLKDAVDVAWGRCPEKPLAEGLDEVNDLLALVQVAKDIGANAKEVGKIEFDLIDLRDNGIPKEQRLDRAAENWLDHGSLCKKPQPAPKTPRKAKQHTKRKG